jgi:hypothetical protein
MHGPTWDAFCGLSGSEWGASETCLDSKHPPCSNHCDEGLQVLSILNNFSDFRTSFFWDKTRLRSGSGILLQAGMLWVRELMRLMIFFSIYLILPAALGPGVYSASNRDEYQKHENNVLVESNLSLVLTTLPSSMNRLSRQCGILNIS